MAKLLQTNLPFATGPNVTAETFNQLVRTLEINLGSIDPDNTLQLTTAERDTLNFNIGQIIYNTTTTTLQYWDGTNFQNISALGAVNLNVSDGSATIGINLGTQTLSLIGGTGITSNASGTSVTFAIDNTVATLTGTQTLTNKTLTSPTLTSPVLNGTLSGSAFLDEDNMASNSATAVASQQSIKAYVDSQVGTVDTLAEILANGNTTGGTDIAVSANDDVTFADSSKAIFGASQDLQIYHDGSNSYIKNSTGSVIIDSGDGGNLIFHDGGGDRGRLIFDAANPELILKSQIADADIKFQGNDAGIGNITALTLDMSNAGAANFNAGISIAGTEVITSSRNLTNIGTAQISGTTNIGSTATGLQFIIHATDEYRINGQDSAGNGFNSIHLRADGTDGLFIQKDTNKVGIGTSSPATKLEVAGNITLPSDGQIKFKGTNHYPRIFASSNNLLVNVDNGSGTNFTALTIDNGGTTTLKGGTADTSDHTLIVRNSSSSALFSIRNDGRIDVGGSQILNSGRNLTNIGTISNTGRHTIQGGNLQMNNGDSSYRYYYVATSSGGGDFLLGQLENNSSTDGAIEGTVCFAYDYGTTSESPKIHFSFAQRSGTARGNWWYEHDDDAVGSNNVKVVLIDDGSGNMYVWLRVGDFARITVSAITRQGSNWTGSGTLSPGTITTGTTLFDTSNDPTSEHHIGKLFTHGDVQLESGSLIVNQEDNGIHLLSANGTEYKLTVSNAGALVITEQ